MLAVSLLIFYMAAVTNPAYAGETDPVSGIDCGCDKTGDYSAPHRGTAPAVKLETTEEGTSPNDRYRIIVSDTRITIRENPDYLKNRAGEVNQNDQGYPGDSVYQDDQENREGELQPDNQEHRDNQNYQNNPAQNVTGELVLEIDRITGNEGWGFSPDDHRFVYHFITAGQQKVRLYDLRQRPARMVKEISRTHITGETSRIRFSPKGVYLFYLSVTASAQNSVSVVDTTGVMAHETSFSHSAGVGMEGDRFHNSVWNFSRDDHDRTLVYGWTTGQNSAHIRAVNLADRRIVSDIPLTTVYSSFWRFSRCADVMALHIQEAGNVSPATPNPVRLRLIGTLDGQNIYNDTFSLIDYTVFSSDETHHRATIGSEVFTLAPNTAQTACPVEPEPEAELSGLSIDETGVTGGVSATGTVTLTLPAPSGGFAVSLTSSQPDVAIVPAMVTVPAGQATATFEIQTVPVSSSVSATIKASAQGIEKSRTLTIGSPRLISMTLDTDTLYSGNSNVLRLQLDGNVPSGGVEITLEHNAGDELELPDAARIWSGRNGSVWFETRGVADHTAIEIEGTLMQTRSVTLHLMPAELHDILYDYEWFSPCVLRWADDQAIGGRSIGFRVELNGEAPPAGAVIQLSSSDPSLVTVPGSVAIEGRGRHAVFQVMSAPADAMTSVPLQASYRQRTLEQPLTLVPPPLQYTVQELKPEGSTWSTPVAMNESGQVLLMDQNDQYYLWQNGIYTPQHFPTPDGLRPVIVDFNDRDQFLGYLREVIHDHGYAVWENGSRLDLHLPYGVTSASVAAINNQGQVAGSYTKPDAGQNIRHIVRWTRGQPEELTGPDHILASDYILIPKDINDRGRVTTSGWRHTQNYQLPLYVSTLHDRNFFRYARAYGHGLGGTHVNNHDTFTGGTTQIFRTDETWHTEIIPPLQIFNQQASGINDHEVIVGHATYIHEAEGYTIRQAIRVTEEGTWPLECLLTDMDAGFELHYGLAINNAGQILAETHLEDEDYNLEYFTWMLTPADASRANLQLSQTTDALSVETGEEVTHTITILNQGPDEAQNVLLSASIPGNQLLISVDSGQSTCEETEGMLLCDAGTLASGASAQVTLVTRAMVPGLSEYRSVVTGSTLETDPASNRALTIVTVTGGDPVTKTAAIGAGETGLVDLSEAGALMEVTEGSSTAGSVSVTMHHDEPENSQDLPMVTVQAPGGPMEPDSVLAGRYWTLEPSGLEEMTYTLCLNISGLEEVHPDFLVVAKRSGSDQSWTAYNSSLRLSDNILYLCTAEMDHFSQFAIATEKGRYTPPDDPPVMPEQVMLAEPLDGEILPPGEVRFRWHHSQPEVLRYRFELAPDEYFSDIRVDSLVTDSLFVWNAPGDNITEWWWRVRAENESGWGPYSEPQTFSLLPVHAGMVDELPRQFELHQNRPNPFNPVTQIRFGLPEPSDVRLEVFNILGQRVAVLVDSRLDAGWHEATFDAGDLSSGLYLCRIHAGATFLQTRKMMLVR